MKKWLEEILEFNLIEVNNYKISVLDLIVVVAIFIIARLLVWGINALIKNRLSKKGIIDEGRSK